MHYPPSLQKESLKPSRCSWPYFWELLIWLVFLFLSLKYHSGVFWHPVIYVGNLSFIYYKFIINILFSLTLSCAIIYIYQKRKNTSYLLLARYNSVVFKYWPKIKDLKTKFSCSNSLYFKLIFCLKNLHPSTNDHKPINSRYKFKIEETKSLDRGV